MNTVKEEALSIQYSIQEYCERNQLSSDCLEDPDLQDAYDSAEVIKNLSGSVEEYPRGCYLFSVLLALPVICCVGFVVGFWLGSL